MKQDLAASLTLGGMNTRRMTSLPLLRGGTSRRMPSPLTGRLGGSHNRLMETRIRQGFSTIVNSTSAIEATSSVRGVPFIFALVTRVHSAVQPLGSRDLPLSVTGNSLGHFVHLLHVTSRFLGAVFLELMFAQLFQHAHLPVGLRQRLPSAFNLFTKTELPSAQGVGLGFEQRRVTMEVQQPVDVDAARAGGRLAAGTHLRYFRGDCGDLVLEELIRLDRLGQLEPSLQAFGISQFQQPFETELVSSHASYPPA